MDASGRFEAINSRRKGGRGGDRGGDGGSIRGPVRRPIGRRARVARSCISTLANHSFRLIVGKSAALRARCHAAQNALPLSLSLPLSHLLSVSISLRYLLSLPLVRLFSATAARHEIPPDRARGEYTVPLNIYRPRGIEFCADEHRVLTRKRGHYDATELRIGKTPRSLSGGCADGKIMRRRGRTEGDRASKMSRFAATSIELFDLYNYLTQ